MKKSIFITGSTGFVGKNLVSYFNYKYQLKYFDKDINKLCIKEDFVIHLAGLSHDLNSSKNLDDYLKVNTVLSNKIFDSFIDSDASVFITTSSIKAVTDSSKIIISEEHIANPKSPYGISKKKAEDYILSKRIPKGKRVYVLRPCMIHGEGNKGNLNLLYKYIKTGFPWLLGSFNNKRSFCSIENLCFIIDELLNNENIDSGIYNVADDEPLSTNDLVGLIGNSLNINVKIFFLPKNFVYLFFIFLKVIGFKGIFDKFTKLTESYEVNNTKLITSIGKKLPISSINGLKSTLKSFNKTHQ